MSVVVRRADLFAEEFDARVITVNCEGYMRKGIALEAARRWPELERRYVEACAARELRPGGIYFYPPPEGVLLATTKDQWRLGSRGSWVVRCAEQLGRLLAQPEALMPFRRVAVPALGCGLGGLPWAVYGPAIAHALRAARPDVEIVLIPPWGPRGGAPAKGAT